MTSFIWIVIAVVIIWLLLRSKQSQQPQSTKEDSIEIPIKVTVSYEKSDHYSDSDDDEDYDKDEWEGSFWEATNPIDLKKSLQLEYTDGAGRKTERIVDVRQFDEGLYGGMLIGHCHMRDATRTFRFDRISKCTDLDTGEIVSDVKKYLKSAYEASPEASIDKLIDEDYETLRVLLYIGKADGQYRKEEKEIVRVACRKLSNDERLTDEMIDKLFANIDIPSTHAFKIAVGKIAKKEAYDFDLIAVAQEMVGTQKTVHAVEKEALEYLEKRLNTKSSL